MFDEKAIEAVVENSMDKKTGARGLRNVLGSAMMEVMYLALSVMGVKRIIISKETIQDTHMAVFESESGKVLKIV